VAIYFGIKQITTKLTIEEVLKSSNYAQPHIVPYQKEAQTVDYMKWDNVAPAAAINSSVFEMSNWLILQMNEGKFKGKQILDPNQVWEMHSAQTTDAAGLAYSKYFPEKHFSSYGLGWQLFDYNGTRVACHGGGADGMISETMIIPEKKIGMVVLTNSINYFPPALMYYVLDDYFGDQTNDWNGFYHSYFKYVEKEDARKEKDDELNRNKNSKPSLDLQAYTGTYGGELYGNATITLQNGKLNLKLLPAPKINGELSHFEYDIFKLTLNDVPTLPSGKVNFIMNDKGEIEEMIINIPNPDFDFTELEFKKLK